MNSCNGSAYCDARVHVHGCLSDTGNCDHPSEHGDWRVAPLAESDIPPLTPEQQQHQDDADFEQMKVESDIPKETA